MLGSGNSGSDSSAEINSDDDITIEGDTDNSSYEWKVPAYAAAGYSNNLIVDCQRILGFDFRGSGTTQARGASFGIPLPGGACKLEKATLVAFDLGNYEMGWTLYCAQKPVWKGMRTVAQALRNVELTKSQAINDCMDTARTVSAPPAQQIVIREEADLSNYASKEELERAFIASQTK